MFKISSSEMDILEQLQKYGDLSKRHDLRKLIV